MLRGGLELNSSIFVFDAWAHERDPLRRSFLEQLIDHLNQISWIKKQDFLGLSNRLSKRYEKSRVRQLARPTCMGYIFSLAALAVPLGIVVVSQGQDGRLKDIPLFVGFLLAFAPVLPVLAVLGITLYRRLRVDKMERPKGMSDFLNALSPLANRRRCRIQHTRLPNCRSNDCGVPRRI